MTERLLPTVLGLLLFLTPALAQAQHASRSQPHDRDDGTTPRVGLGVVLFDVNTLFSDGASENIGFPLPTVLIPVDLNPYFRIEPLIGFTQLRSDRSSETENVEEVIDVLRLGVGLFGKSPRDRTHLYYGGRVGLNRLAFSSERSDGDDEERTADGFFASLTAGSSYFFSSHFSLGGEVELRYASFNEDENGTETTDTTIALRPALVIRFFL